MTTTTIHETDTESLERSRWHLRKLVSEMAALARSNALPAVFYKEFLDRLVLALSAPAAAIWRVDESRSLELQQQVNLVQALGYLDVDADNAHRMLLVGVANTGWQSILPPNSHSESRGDNLGEGHDCAGNPTGHLILLQPVMINERCVAVVEVFHNAQAAPAVREGYAQFMEKTSRSIVDYLNARRLVQLTERDSFWEQLHRFSQNVHSSIDPQAVAYAIVNDGQTLLGCDRVSIAHSCGRTMKILAVSGQETVNQRANVIRALANLATHASQIVHPLVHLGDGDQHTIEPDTPTEQFLSESGATQFIAIKLSPETRALHMKPLSANAEARAASQQQPSSSRTIALPQSNHDRSNELTKRNTAHNPPAVLILEWFSSNPNNTPVNCERVQAVACHAATALVNADQHDRIFLRPVWDWLATRTNRRTTSQVRRLVACLLVATIGAVLALVPGELRMEATGRLMPQHRRQLFAQEDGIVRQLHVTHGSRIKQGEIVAVVENVELTITLQQARARLHRATDELRICEAQFDKRDLDPQEQIRISGQMKSLRDLQESLQHEISLLENRHQKLSVRAPIDATILTWEPERNLIDRPIRRGERMLSLADCNSDWVLEVDMPEYRTGHIIDAQAAHSTPLLAEYVLATQPQTRFQGQVAEIALRAESSVEHGNSVRLVVELDQQDQPPLRPGSEVRVQVRCGERALGYVWFHSLIDFVYARVLF